MLLSFAIEGLYRPLWSEAILDELGYHEQLKLVRRGVDTDEATRRAAHLLNQMRSSFDDACVAGWEGLEGTFGLPDPDDEHVVAAAVVGGAGVIVTDNLRDLPSDRVPAGIAVVTAAQFASETVSVSPPTALSALTTIARRLRRPAMTIDQVLVALGSRYGWHDAVDLLDEAREIDR